MWVCAATAAAKAIPRIAALHKIRVLLLTMAYAVSVQNQLEVLTSVRVFQLGDHFWRAGADEVSAAFAAFRAEVDDPVGGLDDFKVVLDHDDGSASIDETAEGGKKLADIVKVQAGGGLIEDVEHMALATGRVATLGGAGD